MSVTFNRPMLIKVAHKAITDHFRATVAHQKALDDYAVEARKEFDTNQRDRVRKLRDYLTAELKKPGPVDLMKLRKHLGVTDVEHCFFSGVNTYVRDQSVGKPKTLLSQAELEETRALLQVLEAATGDTVSANELRLLGLKNLGPIFVAASTNIGVK